MYCVLSVDLVVAGRRPRLGYRDLCTYTLDRVRTPVGFLPPLLVVDTRPVTLTQDTTNLAASTVSILHSSTPRIFFPFQPERATLLKNVTRGHLRDAARRKCDISRSRSRSRSSCQSQGAPPTAHTAQPVLVTRRCSRPRPQRNPADLAASIPQFRSNWLVDASGNYSSYLKSPTGIATDPALTSHGVEQAHELAAHLMTLYPPVERVYSSPYYRCLQTIEPFVSLWAQSATPDAASKLKPSIQGEAGLSEWYGSASFEHPTSASADKLAELFPAFDKSYASAVVPSRNGESIAQLHDRVALTMEALVKRCDEAGVRAVLLCSHAATVIALGRVLTGNMPENVETEDFRAFTCGLSVFRRRLAARCDADPAGEDPAASGPGVRAPTSQATASPDDYSKDLADPSPAQGDWKDGRGVGGGWLCEVNGDCSFLSGGEERGWRFSGDESFADPGQNGTQQDAGVELGVVVQGRSRNPRL